MNLRRYALFLSVAILTFVIGVTAALLFGGATPLSHSRRSYRRCARLSALPDYKSRFTVYTVYREDGTVLRAYDASKTDGFERLAAPDSDLEPPPPPPASLK